MACFFFRDDKDENRSLAQALRDIAFQIAQTDQLYAKHVASHRAGDVASIRSAWQKLFVDYYLRDGTTETPATFLLLDGIDGALEDDRIIFLNLLKDVDSKGNSSKLHIALTGRPQTIDEIEDRLKAKVSAMHVDSTKIGEDVANYMKSSMPFA